jgi:uncharacterized membrane protein
MLASLPGVVASAFHTREPANNIAAVAMIAMVSLRMSPPQFEFQPTSKA